MGDDIATAVAISLLDEVRCFELHVRRPSEPGGVPPGHLWRWELTPASDQLTHVTHTYDWTNLTDPARLERAQSTGTARLDASLARLAEIAERAIR